MKNEDDNESAKSNNGSSQLSALLTQNGAGVSPVSSTLSTCKDVCRQMLFQSPGVSESGTGVADDASSNGAKDEDDDDEDDDGEEKIEGHDPEKLKAFNVSMREKILSKICRV